MAISFNSVVNFASLKFPSKFQHTSGSSVGSSMINGTKLQYPLRMFESRKFVVTKKSRTRLPVADGDRLATDTANKGSENDEKLVSNDVSTVQSRALDLDSAVRSRPLQTNAADTGFQTTGVLNGSTGSSVKQETPTSPTTQSPTTQSPPKKSMLTARERLRAARVLSRYTETKESKSQLGRNVLDAMRESDRGKRRSGLPEAPTNLLDDSKRGMPKKGLTFDFPGGFDLFLIIFSFVFISTVMFATTFIVWKVGAIHFNEY